MVCNLVSAIRSTGQESPSHSSRESSSEDMFPTDKNASKRPRRGSTSEPQYSQSYGFAPASSSQGGGMPYAPQYGAQYAPQREGSSPAPGRGQRRLLPSTAQQPYGQSMPPNVRQTQDVYNLNKPGLLTRV